VETLQEIRRHIRSVHNLSQVTKALEAVSASRVQKAQSAVMMTRPYAHRAWEMIVNLAGPSGPATHPLLTRREPVRSVLIVLFTSDRGLCGAFNQNIIRAALDYARRLELPVRYIAVGRRGRDVLWRTQADLVAEFHGLPAVPAFLDASPIARAAIDAFLEGHADQVMLAYTDFVNLLQQRPAIGRLLPLRPSEIELQAASEYVVDMKPAAVAEYIYEPSEQAILDAVLPRFTALQVYQAMLESSASEHAARRMAMRNATENAEDLLHDLTLMRNKARQKAITRELLDIAGGAAALEQVREAR